MATKDLYMAWLKDAYAMEKNIEETLEKHAKHAEDYPEIEQKIQDHIRVTREHANLVKDCIERNGEDVSGFKTAMSNVMGNIVGATTGLAKDSVMKNALAEYATEHFEIASYKSLKNAAQELGDHQTAQVCDRIIQDEQRMAQWLEQQMPHVTRQEMQRVGRES